MAARVGIELSPSACRIIEIESGLPWVRRAPVTRVLSFDVLSPSELDSHASLRALRKRSVAAVVWGAPNDHRQVVVTNSSYDSMRREALTALAGAGIETRGVLADIAPATAGTDRSPRRPVVVALAASPPIWDALASLHNAGIRVRSVLTPASALASLARTRRSLAARDSIEAYVAVDEIATCIALVRNGALITARELSWGYLEDVHRRSARRLDEVADRIVAELSEFVSAIGASMTAVTQVCVCGGLSDLRSMTVRMTEVLDVEVEPLDSLYGLDPESLDDRADEFRERCAEMRLAWAAAAVWPPVLDLLHARRRRATKTALSRAAIAAGVVAGLGVGWQIQQSSWWRPGAPLAAPRAATRTTPAQPAPARHAARAATPPPASAPPPVVTPPVPTVASKPTTPAPTVVTPPPASTVASKPATPAPPPVATKPAAPENSSARVGREPERVQAPPPRTDTRPSPPTVVRPSTPASATRTETPRAEPPPRRQAPPRLAPVETPLAFEASLGTILYSPDRKLAIIDGRIVGVGDEVHGARVTEITPNAVLLRDAQGRLRRLALTGSR